MIGKQAGFVLDDGTTVMASPAEGAQELRVDGIVLPSRYTVTAQGGPLSHVVHLVVEVEDGQPVVTRATYERRPSGPPVTNASVRVPVERLVSLATQAVGVYLDDAGEVRALLPASQADLDAAERIVRRPTGHERLVRVAEAWRWARLNSPRSPLAAAAKRVHESRSTFDRLRNDALAAGLLHPHEVPRRGRDRSVT